MNNTFRSLDEIFNLPIQNYPNQKDFVEEINYTTETIKPSAKKNSLSIKPQPQILKIKSKERNEVIYTRQDSNRYDIEYCRKILDNLKELERQELERYQQEIKDKVMEEYFESELNK